jgi:retron-type reverse transcriptase
VKWVLDADLWDFFGSLEHEQLIRFVEHPIGDKRLVRLIQQWLAAGVLEEAAWTRSETGSRVGVSHPWRPICTCTTCSTCGSSGGVGQQRGVT